MKRSRPQLTTIAVPVLVLVGCSQSLSPAAPTYMFADDHATVLERDWVANKNGTVLYAPTALRATVVQVRPDVADPPSLTDVRVRRALAYGIDGATANDVLNAGRGLLTATLTSPKVDYYARIERVITRYDYDPRKSQQLMEEAGFAKGADGFFVRDGTRFQVGVWASSGAKNEKENAVIVGSLHKSGFDATTHVFSAAQLADAQARALIPGLGTRGIATRPLSANISAAIPRAENRWTGENRGGWANPLYDRAFEGFSRALDRNERIQHNAELEQVYTQELPSIPHWFSPSITAYTSQLSGPVARLTPDSTTAIHHIHEWEWRS